MRLLAVVLTTLLELVFLYELFVYGIRRYEILNSGEPPPRYGIGNAVGWFLAEWAARSLFLLTAPLGFLWPFDKPTTAAPKPIVLLHGYGTTRTSLAVLAWRLRQDGFGPIHVVAYRTLFGSLAEATRRFEEEVARALTATAASSVDVVAHSLGGLVARKALRDPALAGRVRKLVTIGCPHQGTKLAALAVDSLGRELHPESDLLHALGEAGPPTPPVAATSIFSTFDALVLPSRSGFLRGAVNVEIAGVGHNMLLLSSKVHALVREALDDSTSPRWGEVARSVGEGEIAP
jgi:pimeloyl-ACP methyl ester carboxylesterase